MERADNVCHEQRLLEGTSACDEATENASGYGDSHTHIEEGETLSFSHGKQLTEDDMGDRTWVPVMQGTTVCDIARAAANENHQSAVLSRLMIFICGVDLWLDIQAKLYTPQHGS